MLLRGQRNEASTHAILMERCSTTWQLTRFSHPVQRLGIIRRYQFSILSRTEYHVDKGLITRREEGNSRRNGSQKLEIADPLQYCTYAKIDSAVLVSLPPYSTTSCSIRYYRKRIWRIRGISSRSPISKSSSSLPPWASTKMKGIWHIQEISGIT